MPSFAALLLLATSAFTAMTAAAPVGPSTNGGSPTMGNIVVAPVTGINADVDVFDARQDTLRSLPAILTDVKSQVSSVSDKLNAVVAAAEVDIADVTPLINDLTTIIGGAVAEVEALAGHPVEVVLALGDKVVSLVDIANLLASVLSIVAGILAVVAHVLGGLKNALVAPLLAEVGGVVAKLLGAILANVSGLLNILLPVLGSVLPILQSLGLGAVLNILHL